MDFENINNLNIALEAAAKKPKKSIKSALVHAIKKFLRRTKCCAVPQPKTQEELDNLQNEALEAKSRADSDLKQFHYITQHLTATHQS